MKYGSTTMSKLTLWYVNCVKNTIKNILSKYTFVVFCFCCILCILRGKKIRNCFLGSCAANLLYWCFPMFLFLDWRAGTCLVSSSVQQGNTTHIIFVTYCWRLKHCPYIIYTTKGAEEVVVFWFGFFLVISSSLLVSFATVSVPNHSQEARYLKLSTVFFSC